MNRVFQLRDLSGRLVKKSKAHCIMSIRNWESHRMMEQSSCRRQEGFTENHGSNRCGPNEPVAVIERLSSSPDWSSEKALKVPGCFAIATQPFDKVGQNICDLGRRWIGCLCCLHLNPCFIEPWGVDVGRFLPQSYSHAGPIYVSTL